MFKKFRFSNGTEHTAGLVIDSKEVVSVNLPKLSRMFPKSEISKMRYIQSSPVFETYEEALNYEF